MVSRGNHPQMAQQFRLVKYYFIYPDLWKDPPFFMGKSTKHFHIIYTIIDIDMFYSE